MMLVLDYLALRVSEIHHANWRELVTGAGRLGLIEINDVDSRMGPACAWVNHRPPRELTRNVFPLVRAKPQSGIVSKINGAVSRYCSAPTHIKDMGQTNKPENQKTTDARWVAKHLKYQNTRLENKGFRAPMEGGRKQCVTTA